MADTFYAPAKAAWRQQVAELLTQGGVTIHKLQGGAFRILAGNDLTLATDLAEIKPGEVGVMVRAQARHDALHG
jgi:hypothetical protein